MNTGVTAYSLVTYWRYKRFAKVGTHELDFESGLHKEEERRERLFMKREQMHKCSEVKGRLVLRFMECLERTLHFPVPFEIQHLNVTILEQFDYVSK